jgi:hypothetical protein
VGIVGQPFGTNVHTAVWTAGRAAAGPLAGAEVGTYALGTGSRQRSKYCVCARLAALAESSVSAQRLERRQYHRYTSRRSAGVKSELPVLVRALARHSRTSSAARHGVDLANGLPPGKAGHFIDLAPPELHG